MVSSVETGESLEPIETTHLVKDLGVELNSTMGRENTGTTAGGLLCKGWVRCAIGTQEKLWGSTGCGLSKCRTMNLGLRMLSIDCNVLIGRVSF